MAVQGLRDTSGFTVGGTLAQRPENWREGILLLFPNGDMPLVGLTSLLRSGSTDDAKYHQFEKVMSDQRLAISSTINNSVTVIPVSAGALETKIGTILYVEETGELMRVTQNPSVDTSLPQVVRGFAGTSAAAVTVGTDNPYMRIIGSAYEEGSSAPSGVSYDPEEQFNYTQIFRNTIEATRTAIQTRLRTGDQVREAKREALQYHAIEMEMAFWFGSRSISTVNGKPMRTTEGFFAFMNRREPTRVVTGEGTGADWDLAYLEEQLKNIFDYGSSEKMAFCGNRALLTIQQIIRLNSNSPYQIVQGQREFGMAVSRLVSPFGEIVLKQHPLFSRMMSSTGSPAYWSVDSWIAVMDMESARYRYLDGADTQYTTKLQLPGDDQSKAGYLTEGGMEWSQPKTHYVMKNVAVPKVDA